MSCCSGREGRRRNISLASPTQRSAVGFDILLHQEAPGRWDLDLELAPLIPSANLFLLLSCLLTFTRTPNLPPQLAQSRGHSGLLGSQQQCLLCFLFFASWCCCWGVCPEIPACGRGAVRSAVPMAAHSGQRAFTQSRRKRKLH